MTFCRNCGAALKPGAKFCEICGSKAEPTAGPAPTAPAQPVAVGGSLQQAPAAGGGQKNPVIAALLSFLFTGLGQVYNGNLVKGLIVFFAALIGFFLFVIPGIIVLVYAIYDAYTTAKKMNDGQVPFVPYSVTHVVIFIVVGLAAGIAVFFILAGMVASMTPYYY